MRHILPILLLCIASGGLAAQTTLQVITRNIRKTVPWKPGYEVVINGEKAEVELTPTDTNAVIITAELSARHPNADTAAMDLESWQFVVNTLGKKIYIRSYIGLQDAKKTPVSNMKAKIWVSIPKNCGVDLSNKFGKAHLEHLNGPIALNGEFCHFKLTDLSGTLDVESRYGSIEGTDLRGKTDLRSKRADIRLEAVQADCTISAEYGKIQIFTSSTSGNITLTGNKSEVQIQADSDSTHNFILSSEYGDLTVPGTFDTSGSSGNIKKAVVQHPLVKKIIQVATSFGNITWAKVE